MGAFLPTEKLAGIGGGGGGGGPSVIFVSVTLSCIVSTWSLDVVFFDVYLFLYLEGSI